MKEKYGKTGESVGRGLSLGSRMCILLPVFLTMFLLLVATALAQVQSHRLSEIRTIDKNLDMGSYQLNASRVNATFGYISGTLSVGALSPIAMLQVNTTAGGAAILGDGGSAAGIAAVATGYRSNASGNYAVAMGVSSKANRTGSTATGGLTVASGDYSTAMGYQSTASGVRSTAMGEASVASGADSIAAGWMSTASGIASVAMGWLANSSSEATVALGYRTKATNLYAVAMGYNTTASGGRSTAMGDSIIVSGVNSFGIGLNSIPYTLSQSNTLSIMGGSVGIGTVSPKQALDVNGSVNVTGAGVKVYTPELCLAGDCKTVWPAGGGGGLGGSGSARHVAYWHNSTAVTYDSDGMFYWDNDTNRLGIGTTSPGARLDVEVSSGGAATIGHSSNSATGDYAVAMGYNSNASGDYSTALGGTLASGDYSTAMGDGAVASGAYSTAMGRWTVASNIYSTAMGESTIASGSSSTAMGGGSITSGDFSTAMGHETDASGDSSTAMGDGTVASGDYSTAMGAYTVASGAYSTAMGGGIESGGAYSVAIALNNQGGTNVSHDNTMAIMGGNVGIGTTNPNATLHVAGKINVTAGNDICIDGGNCLSSVGGGGDSSWNVTGSNMYPNSTGYNVGIGMTNPEEKLDIYSSGGSDAGIRMWSNDAVGDPFIQFTTDVTDWYAGIDNSDSDKFMIGSGATVGTTSRLVIDTSGSVGIGTTNPASKLSVGGVGSSTYAIYGNGSTGVYGDGTSYGVYGNASSTGVRGTGSTGVSGVGGATGVYGTGTSTGVLAEATDSSANRALVASASGSTIYNYGVYALADSTGAGSTGTNYGIVGNATGGSSSKNYGVYATASGGESYAGYFDGNVRVVGNANITGTVYASNVSSNSPLQLQTKGTTRVYVNDTTGYIGIGTTNPGQLLTINKTVSGEKESLFSVDQMQLSQLHGGAYFGRVGLKEAQWALGGYGTNWSIKDSTGNWMGVSMSSDGRIQATAIYGGQIYVSKDYGATWVAKESLRTWHDVGMSSDGKIMVAANYGGGSIYVSTDYGETWAAKGPSKYWDRVAVSSDGKVMLAGFFVVTSQLYVSRDFGNNWVATGPSDIYYDVAMSSDGRIQAAAPFSNTATKYIQVSYDYGATWASKGAVGRWESVAMSSDGKIMLASVLAGQLQVSTDYGETWTAKGPSVAWKYVTMSSDGRIMAATTGSTQIYISEDYGETWTAQGPTSSSWQGVAMSSDGLVMTATESGVGSKIYVSYANVYNQGNVGIGTTNPATKLHSSTTGANNTLRIQTIGGGDTTSQVPQLEFWHNYVTTGYTALGAKIYSTSNGGSYADSRLTIATGDNVDTLTAINGKVGIGTTDPAAKLHVNITGGGAAVLGGGPGISALGTYSVAMGYNANASNFASIAMGDTTKATGPRSTAMGTGTSAIGSYSTALGYWTNASGDYSTAMGRNTTAFGDYSTAMGRGTLAEGDDSTAMGNGTSASGIASTTMGVLTGASGKGAVAMGYYSSAGADYAVAMGYNTQAYGLASTTMGRGIEVTGDYSVGIALNDQSATSVSQNNVMAIMGGNVGIGTTTPNVSLVVSNSVSSGIFEGIRIHNTWSGVGGESALTFHAGTGGTRMARIMADPMGNNLSSLLLQAGNGTDYMTLVTLNGSSRTVRLDGNVGIGTTNPTAIFEVQCPAGFTNIKAAKNQLGCMQSNTESSDAFYNALEDCFDTYGATLPSPGEISISYNNYALTNEVSVWADATRGTSSYAVCNTTACAAIVDTVSTPYRCWIPR